MVSPPVRPPNYKFINLIKKPRAAGHTAKCTYTATLNRKVRTRSKFLSITPHLPRPPPPGFSLYPSFPLEISHSFKSSLRLSLTPALTLTLTIFCNYLPRAPSHFFASSLSHSLSHPASPLSLPPSRSPARSPGLSLHLSISISLPLYISLPMSPYLGLPLCLSLSFFVSPFLSLTLSVHLPLTLHRPSRIHPVQPGVWDRTCRKVWPRGSHEDRASARGG